MKPVNYKFFLRTDQVSPSGKVPIYIILTKNKHKKYLSTSIWVFPKHWDALRCEVKRGDISYIAYNAKLSKYKEQILSFLNNADYNGLDVSVDMVHNLLSYGIKGISVYKFIDRTIEESRGIFSDATLTRYKTLSAKLKSFRNELYFSDITPSFIGEYRRYLSLVRKNSENTIMSTLSFLKAIISKARIKGFTNIHPFDDIKIKQAVGHRENLSMQELERLEDLFWHGEISSSHKNVLGYFLFACFTGLRFADISNLKMADIKNSMVNTITQKTKVWVKIPLSKRAISLVQEPYNGSPFRVITNQKTNAYLKEIIKIAKINKRITFHCARHTFATLCRDLEIPIHIISKFLGHKNIKTTEIYLHDCSDRKKMEEMTKWDKLLVK